jgi:hypothetical protein
MEICSFIPASAKTSMGQGDSITLLRKIGAGIGSRIASKLTEAYPPFQDSKDAVKFICKDMWYFLYRQQATRLQANRKGVFVIHDSTFPPLQIIAKSCIPAISPHNINAMVDAGVGPLTHSKLVPASQQQLQEDPSPASSSSRKFTNEKGETIDVVQSRAFDYLALNAGVIEGFLGSVGFECTVEASIAHQIPACAFQITLRQSTSEILNPSRLLGTVPGDEAASI